MTDQRSTETVPDSLPEDGVDVVPDSLTSTQDDAARTDIEGDADVRSTAKDVGTADEGVAGERSGATAQFADVDDAPGAETDPLID